MGGFGQWAATYGATFMVVSTLFVLFTGALWWALATHEVEGEVTAMTWTHVTHLDQWTPKTVSGFAHETTERRETKPKAGVGERAGMQKVPLSCRQKHHHYEQYQCGTRQEDYDCSTSHTESYSDTCSRSESYNCGETCRDNGNGFATCYPKTCSKQVSYSCTKTRTVRDPKTCTRTVPKYCDRSIERLYCNYTTQVWKEVKAEVARGQGPEDLYFKDMQADELSRIRHTSDYTVQIAYPCKKEAGCVYEAKPKLTSVYRSWTVGEAPTLVVRNIGNIKEVKRKGMRK